MKRIIKRILPRPMLAAAIRARDAARLAVTPRRTFDHQPLLPDAALVLERILADRGLAAAWETDHRAIGDVFGYENLASGVNPGDRRALYALTGALKPQRVLEIGTHIGASTLYIARALNTHVPSGRLVTVDILDVNDPAAGWWKKVGLGQAPRDMARQLDCLERLTFVTRPALDYLGDAGEDFDLIFLDGDHSPRAVYEEMAAALEILRPNGTILLHDYYPDARPLFSDGKVIAGPFLALRRIMRENPEIAVRPLGTLPWPTKQGSHATSLALVTRANI